MLIEDFFAAVDRAFTREMDKLPVQHRLEVKTPSELPLVASGSFLRQRRLPQRCRLPERRYYRNAD